MSDFQLISNFLPTGDQPTAIKSLLDGYKDNRIQVLLGATGTGKTFTIANIINKINKPTLVMVHNKTLAGQLYSEFKSLFPNNHVEYFVSNFDFYQPEAYIPKSDTYIDKEAVMNEQIEMLRASTINSLLQYNDTIVVASVAAIYALNDPDEYKSLVFSLKVSDKINIKEITKRLVASQYQRNDIDLSPSKFRVTGDVLEIAPPDTTDYIYRIEFFDGIIESISTIDPLTKKTKKRMITLSLFPAYSHTSSQNRILRACPEILKEMEERVKYFDKNGKLIEAQRIRERTEHDVESLKEFGMCPGIENYSRHIDGRAPGVPPFSLFDYFPKDFLLVIDESHVSIPQIEGMFAGDRSRKTTLVEYGFRLPSALDNRPMTFIEFEKKINRLICTSATPGNYETKHCKEIFSEQIIRPTGLIDPIIEIKSKNNQIDDIIEEINDTINQGFRLLITTLTIKMAETLTDYLKNRSYKVTYLHSETKTLDRSKIIYELRSGKFDILIGINLLREGLDLPEVQKILILDADKAGFLRSDKSLIQIIGRAARNDKGKVIMYADEISDSMKRAIDETNRRRAIQERYNLENNITPKTIIKELLPPANYLLEDSKVSNRDKRLYSSNKDYLRKLEKEMLTAAKEMDFERAAEIRDLIIELKATQNK